MTGYLLGLAMGNGIAWAIVLWFAMRKDSDQIIVEVVVLQPPHIDGPVPSRSRSGRAATRKRPESSDQNGSNPAADR